MSPMGAKRKSKNGNDEINNINMASELFVASECYRRGWICNVTMGNAKCCDLLVKYGKEQKALEVKAKSGKDGSWCMDKPNERDKNLIYVLVDYRGHFRDHIERPKSKKRKRHWRPKCYIIPSRDIGKYWDKKAGRNGGIRLSRIRYEKRYHERWTNIIDDGHEDGPPPESRKARSSQF